MEFEEIFNRLIAGKPNIVIQYSYNEQDADGEHEVETWDVVNEKYMRFDFIPVGGKLERAYVPVVCTHCGEVYLLETEFHYTVEEEKDMGLYQSWIFEFEGNCPCCGGEISLCLDVGNYPQGDIEAIQECLAGNRNLRYPNNNELQILKRTRQRFDL